MQMFMLTGSFCSTNVKH